MTPAASPVRGGTELAERGRPVHVFDPRLLAGLTLLAAALAGGCARPATTMPGCEPGGRLGILAQAVPTASRVPCLKEMPVGWNFDALDVDSERARFWLDSDRAGVRAAEVELSSTCDVGGATPVAVEEEATRRYQRLTSLSPRFVGTTYDVFDGGCVTYRYDLVNGPHIVLYQELHEAVSLFSRQGLAEDVRADLGVDLDPKGRRR